MFEILLVFSLLLFLTLTLFLKTELFFFLYIFLNFLQDLLIVSNENFSLEVTGIELYTNDFFFLAQIFYSFQYLIINFFIKRTHTLSKIQLFICLLFLFTIFKIFYSSLTFGTFAFVTSRGILYFLGNILFFSLGTLDPKRILRFFQMMFFFSFIYLFVALFRYFEILPSLYSNIDFMVWEDDFSANRLLDKDQLMFILFGSIFSASFIYSQSRFLQKIYILFFTIFSLLILFSNTRSIILVYLLSMVYFLFFNKMINIKTISFFLGIALFSYGIFLSFDVLLVQKYFAAFTYENLFSENSTFFWRGVVTVGYLGHMNIFSYFLGMPFGDMPIIFLEQFNTISGGTAGLHNFYVQILYYFGLPITLLLFGSIFKIFLELQKLKEFFPNDINNINTINTILFSIFVCYLAWPTHIFESIIIGLSISMLTYYKGINDKLQMNNNK